MSQIQFLKADLVAITKHAELLRNEGRNDIAEKVERRIIMLEEYLNRVST